MKKTQINLVTMTETSLFAALIFLSIQFFRIPVGAQFIHFGNALVIVGCLLFGTKRGFLAAAIGLGIFDLLNGYVAELPIILFESLVVALLIHVLYERLFAFDDKPFHIVQVALAAAVIKILLNLGKYWLTALLLGSASPSAAFFLALAKITGTFGSSLATVIAVPLLYPIFKRIYQGFARSSRLSKQ